MPERPTTYGDIIENIRAIILDSPDWNAVFNPDAPPNQDPYENVETGTRQLSVSTYNDYKYQLQTTGSPIDRSETPSKDYSRAVLWIDLPTEEVFKELSAQALILPRYNDISPIVTFAGPREVIDWEIELDILVSGTEDERNLNRHAARMLRSGNAPAQFPTNIYSPKRGKIIEHFVKQLQKYPSLSYPDYQRVNSENYFPMDEISLAEMRDSTDLNYWTLMWAEGFPQAFLGWWPQTLCLKIKQNFNPGVRY